MKTIKLYGHLGKQFGKIHKYYVDTPSEAIQLLIANYKGFEQALLNFTGEGYRVIVGKEDIGVEDLKNSTGQNVFKIIPVISGQGGGLGMIVLGAALMIVAPYAEAFIIQGGLAGIGISGLTGLAVAGYVSSAMAAYGMSMVLGGISQMLYVPPTSTNARLSTSGSFDGAINTTRQGMPIAVGYGTLIVGSAIISAGLSTVSVPV